MIQGKGGMGVLLGALIGLTIGIGLLYVAGDSGPAAADGKPAIPAPVTGTNWSAR